MQIIANKNLVNTVYKEYQATFRYESDVKKFTDDFVDSI